MYSKVQLQKLLEGAKRLGFQDDIQHWTNELAKLETNGS